MKLVFTLDLLTLAAGFIAFSLGRIPAPAIHSFTTACQEVLFLLQLSFSFNPASSLFSLLPHPHCKHYETRINTLCQGRGASSTWNILCLGSSVAPKTSNNQNPALHHLLWLFDYPYNGIRQPTCQWCKMFLLPEEHDTEKGVGRERTQMQKPISPY